MKNILALIIYVLVSAVSSGQSTPDKRTETSDATPGKRLKFDIEYRPRAEYRNGYQQLRNDSSSAAFFVNQRIRIGANYVHNNKYIVQFSVQDLRVWGQQDPRSTLATLQIFEGWVEPLITERFSVRIGRQRLMYDNQRLFAENDWRLGGSVHDALNFKLKTTKITTELALAFNQTSERYFGTDYVPTGFANYKFLAVNFLTFKASDVLTLTTLNSADAYQHPRYSKRMNFRYNLGGRLEVRKNSLYTTIAAYYQTGKNPTGTKLSAWYVQPEVSYTLAGGLNARLGAEIFSGNDNSKLSTTDHSFVPLYGVAHRFNGSMDLITKFPNDVDGAGLINPYLFLIQPVSKKIDLRADLHAFFLQKNYYQDNIKTDKYLGFENDLLFTFKPEAGIKIDFGFSFMLPTQTFELIKKAGNSKYDLTWMFLSFTFKPQLPGINFK